MSVNFADEILAPFGLNKKYQRSPSQVIRHLSLVLIVWHNFQKLHDPLRRCEGSSGFLACTTVSFTMLTEHRAA